MTVYEVFRRERKGQPFEHAGSIEAPDAAFADTWAREQYGRRGESDALWLVPRGAIPVHSESRQPTISSSSASVSSRSERALTCFLEA